LTVPVTVFGASGWSKASSTTSLIRRVKCH
jgi:hypothetical protein